MTGRAIKSMAKGILSRVGVTIKRDPGRAQLHIGRNTSIGPTVMHSEILSSNSRNCWLKQLSFSRSGGSLKETTNPGNFQVTLSGEPVTITDNDTWSWPAHLRNGVRTADIKNTMDGDIRQVVLDFRNAQEKTFAGIFTKVVREPIMSMFLMGRENGKAFAKGWVYDPDNQPRADQFRLNGEVAQTTLTTSQPGWEAHLGPVFAHFSMKGEEHFAFFETTTEASWPDDEVVLIEYQTSSTRPVNRCRFANVEDRLPMPEGETFKRVSGNPNPFTFRLSGCTASLMLRDVVHHYLDKTVAQLDRVLDWGCGCGRVSRHFAEDAKSTDWCGVDIDEVGIQWAQENLPFGNFRHIEPLEKLPFPNNHFEFIFGISVFTHLREPDHLFWLQELERVVANNSIVAVSIGGQTLRARLFTTDIDELANDEIAGYTDHGRSDAIDGSTNDVEYYRSTFISENYVHSVWSRYFDVLDIHPGLVGCRQDLVILRKK